MNALLKVDIASRRVLDDNLENYYARQCMGEGRPDPVWHNNPAINQIQLPSRALWEQHLFKRICDFNKKRRKNSTNWDEHSLFRLALLVEAGYSFPCIAAQLGQPVRSCRSMYNSMKRAGVVKNERSDQHAAQGRLSGSCLTGNRREPL